MEIGLPGNRSTDQGENMHIVYIHGNRASASSFNFIRSKITGHRETILEYDSDDGFDRNHDRMMEQLDGVENIFFIAHSLGGIHAFHLAHHLGERVLGGVTMSTPYGGSSAASLVACFMPFSQVMKDIRPTGGPILQAQAMATPAVWTNIVSVAGASPFMLEPNDGVVTLKSMRHRRDMRLVEVDCNHFEVVLSEQAVAIIRQSIGDAEDAKGAIRPERRMAAAAGNMLQLFSNGQSKRRQSALETTRR